MIQNFISDQLDTHFYFHSTSGKNKNFTGSLNGQDFMASPADYHIEGLPCLFAGGNIQYSVPVTYQTVPFSCFLFMRVISGEASIHIGNHTEFLSASSFLFLGLQEPLTFETKKTPFLYEIYFCGNSILPVYFDQLSVSTDKETLFHTHCPNDSYIELKLRQFQQILHHPSDIAVFHIAKNIMDILTECMLINKQLLSVGQELPEHIYAMKTIFEQDYSKELRLDELEQRIGISKYKLSRDFSACMGITPIKYLNQIRIQKAKDLLKKTDLTIYAVGTNVGIKNTTHFIRLFQRETGLTPMQYRQAETHQLHGL